MYSHTKQRYLGFVDMIDIIAVINEKSPDIFDLLCASQSELTHKASTFLLAPVGDYVSAYPCWLVLLSSYSISACYGCVCSCVCADTLRSRIQLVPKNTTVSYALSVVCDKVWITIPLLCFVDHTTGFINTPPTHRSNALQSQTAPPKSALCSPRQPPFGS